jgi:hypothetical protein
MGIPCFEMHPHDIYALQVYLQYTKKNLQSFDVTSWAFHVLKCLMSFLIYFLGTTEILFFLNHVDLYAW